MVILSDNTNPSAGYGPGPSYLEEFYTTAVHEFGHALGLQHTWTAAAMSQDVIRNTSRRGRSTPTISRRCSELYGRLNWNANSGSISGHGDGEWSGVEYGFGGGHSAGGSGGERADEPRWQLHHQRIASGPVHALRPSAAAGCGPGGTGCRLTLPFDATGHQIAPRSGYFHTDFYPATTDLTQATLFTVAAGQALTGDNFQVATPRATIPVYDIVTWAWLNPIDRVYGYVPNGNWITPAYAGTGQSFFRLYAEANSLVVTPQPASA